MDSISLYPISCRATCGKIPNDDEKVKETMSIFKVPKYTVYILESDLNSYDMIIIEGTLIIHCDKNIKISAYGIWIWGGTFIVEGCTPGSPYLKNLNIILRGDRESKK